MGHGRVDLGKDALAVLNYCNGIPLPLAVVSKLVVRLASQCLIAHCSGRPVVVYRRRIIEAEAVDYTWPATLSSERRIRDRCRTLVFVPNPNRVFVWFRDPV